MALVFADHNLVLFAVLFEAGFKSQPLIKLDAWIVFSVGGEERNPDVGDMLDGIGGADDGDVLDRI